MDEANRKTRLALFLGTGHPTEIEKIKRQRLIRLVVWTDVAIGIIPIFVSPGIWPYIAVGWVAVNAVLYILMIVAVRRARRRGDYPDASRGEKASQALLSQPFRRVAPSLVLAGASCLLVALLVVVFPHGSITGRVVIGIAAAILGLVAATWGILILRQTRTSKSGGH